LAGDVPIVLEFFVMDEAIEKLLALLEAEKISVKFSAQGGLIGQNRGS
jgi:hypothetical protein